MVFKDLKGYYRMDQIDSINSDIVDSLIWVSVLTLMCSRKSASIDQKCRSGASEPLLRTYDGRRYSGRMRTGCWMRCSNTIRATSGYVNIVRYIFRSRM